MVALSAHREGLGRNSAALEDYQTVVKVEPQNKEAARRIESLEAQLAAQPDVASSSPS